MDESPKDPHVIRVADFSDPKPFKTTQGAFHPYTYIPFLGWLPPVELNILIALVAIGLAIAVPQPTLARKIVGFFLVPAALLCLFGVIMALAWVGMGIQRLYFARFGRAAIARRLSDPRSEVRCRAADELGAWEEAAKESVPELVKASRDPEGRVRMAAVEALGRIGPAASRAVQALIDRLEDKDLAWAAAQALGRIGPAAEAAVPALIELLRHPEEGTRCQAAEALGKLGPKAAMAVPALARALDDTYYLTRCHAAAALGELGAAAAAAVPALIRRLDDPETFWQAARSLGRIGGPEASRALEAMLAHADARRREEAAHALARLRAPEPPSQARPTSK